LYTLRSCLTKQQAFPASPDAIVLTRVDFGRVRVQTCAASDGKLRSKRTSLSSLVPAAYPARQDARRHGAATLPAVRALHMPQQASDKEHAGQRGLQKPLPTYGSSSSSRHLTRREPVDSYTPRLLTYLRPIDATYLSTFSGALEQCVTENGWQGKIAGLLNCRCCQVESQAVTRRAWNAATECYHH
jgi:hypothetical protein